MQIPATLGLGSGFKVRLVYNSGTHSVKRASTAIASIQQSTHEAKCTLWTFLQSVFHLYVHAL